MILDHEALQGSPTISTSTAILIASMAEDKSSKSDDPQNFQIVDVVAIVPSKVRRDRYDIRILVLNREASSSRSDAHKPQILAQSSIPLPVDRLQRFANPPSNQDPPVQMICPCQRHATPPSLSSPSYNTKQHDRANTLIPHPRRKLSTSSHGCAESMESQNTNDDIQSSEYDNDLSPNLGHPSDVSTNSNGDNEDERTTIVMKPLTSFKRNPLSVTTIAWHHCHYSLYLMIIINNQIISLISVDLLKMDDGGNLRIEAHLCFDGGNLMHQFLGPDAASLSVSRESEHVADQLITLAHDNGMVPNVLPPGRIVEVQTMARSANPFEWIFVNGMTPSLFAPGVETNMDRLLIAPLSQPIEELIILMIGEQNKPLIVRVPISLLVRCQSNSILCRPDLDTTSLLKLRTSVSSKNILGFTFPLREIDERTPGLSSDGTLLLYTSQRIEFHSIPTTFKPATLPEVLLPIIREYRLRCSQKRMQKQSRVDCTQTSHHSLSPEDVEERKTFDAAPNTQSSAHRDETTPPPPPVQVNATSSSATRSSWGMGSGWSRLNPLTKLAGQLITHVGNSLAQATGLSDSGTRCLGGHGSMNVKSDFFSFRHGDRLSCGIPLGPYCFLLLDTISYRFHIFTGGRVPPRDAGTLLVPMLYCEHTSQSTYKNCSIMGLHSSVADPSLSYPEHSSRPLMVIYSSRRGAIEIWYPTPPKEIHQGLEGTGLYLDQKKSVLVRHPNEQDVLVKLPRLTVLPEIFLKPTSTDLRTSDAILLLGPEDRKGTIVESSNRIKIIAGPFL